MIAVSLVFPDNKEVEMEARLESFKDSQLGAEFVYQWAASFGFTAGQAAITAELFRAVSRSSRKRGGGGSKKIRNQPHALYPGAKCPSGARQVGATAQGISPARPILGFVKRRFALHT